MRRTAKAPLFIYTRPGHKFGGEEADYAPEFSAEDGERRDVRPGAADGMAPAVLSFGYSRYRKHYPQLPEHIHPSCFEINYCQRGVPVFSLGDASWPVKPGHIFMSKPGEPHHLTTNISGLFLYWLLFKKPSRSSERAMGLSAAEADDIYERLMAIDSPVFPVRDDMRLLFQELFRTYDAPASPFRTVMLRSTVLRIILAIIRDCERKPQRLFGRNIQATARQIGARPEERYTIADLARQNGLSQGRFASLFKRATGFPPRKMILMQRMEKARRLVVNSNMPITQIAYAVGFSSPRHFADQFRRTHGESARQMRASARKSAH